MAKALGVMARGRYRDLFRSQRVEVTRLAHIPKVPSRFEGMPIHELVKTPEAWKVTTILPEILVEQLAPDPALGRRRRA